MIETIVFVVLLLGLIGTVVWAGDRYLTIPGPFAWVKGVLMFLLVVVCCYVIYDQFLAHGFSHHR